MTKNIHGDVLVSVASRARANSGRDHSSMARPLTNRAMAPPADNIMTVQNVEAVIASPRLKSSRPAARATVGIDPANAPTAVPKAVNVAVMAKRGEAGRKRICIEARPCRFPV